MKKSVVSFLQLFTAQAVAQALLVAMGNSLRDACIFVSFLTFLAPLYFPRVQTLYRQAFSVVR